jgi:hypothetical protein
MQILDLDIFSMDSLKLFQYIDRKFNINNKRK